jgi:hypothetical protein
MDASSQSSAVSLGVFGLIDELIPVSIAGREDLFVGKPDCDAGRVEGVFEEFKGAPQVALPARHVAHQENVEGPIPRGIEHGHHLGAAIDGPTGMSCCPDEAGIDQAEPADRGVLKFDLCFGAVSVELARGALAYPASGAKTA